jgi:hypothetical protein
VTLHSRFFRFVSAVSCGTLIALPLQNGYVSSAAPDAATTFTNSLRALQDAENAAPRDHWDPTYVEGQLGRDPARTFAWVRDHTYWIPYHGILRGPAGVLMDRQGDSLDRALLLATMLKDEGLTVRLAHGTMARSRAETLMPALLTARTLRDAAPKAERPALDVSSVAAKYELDPAPIQRTLAAQMASRAAQRRTLEAHFNSQVRRLTAAVDQTGADAASRARERAIAALADHWWVEVQVNGVWQPRDLLADEAAGAHAADRTLDVTALPADLYHQITLRVVAEQWSGGTTVEHTALEQTMRAPDVLGQPIALQFTPGEAVQSFPTPGLDPAASVRANALAQHEWTPSLYVGKQHVVQNAITDAGTITAPSNGADALGVAKGVAHGLGDAIAGVFGPAPATPAAPPPAPGVLSAVWIEYAIAVPGEPTQVIRRQIFDLPGAARRASKSATWTLDDAGRLARGLALMTSTEILPVNSEFSPQYVAHLSRAGILANGALVSDVLSGKIADDFQGAQAASARFVPTGGSLYGLALQRLNRSPVAPFIYVDRPEILSRHLFLSLKGTTLTPAAATDIVANGVGVDPIGPSPFSVAVAQGVYDTNGESIYYSSQPDAGNAGWAYGQSSDWVTLSKPGDPVLASLQLGDDVRERIAEALASNHVVVAPRTRVPISGDGFAGWWQIDKTTGETLGIGDSGWGQGIAGYVVLALTLVSAFVNGWLYCELQPPNGSSTVVADAAFGHANRGRFRHLIDPAVDASSVDCIGQALISLFLGAANAAYEANLGGIRGPTGGGAPENDGEGPGGSLPNDPAGSDGPAGPTSGQGGQPGQGGQGGSAPNGTAGAGGGGAPGGNAGGGSGGGGDAPAPEGNPAGGKWTRQQLMDYYTNRRASTDPSIDGKSRWTNEYVMRQPDASDFVRDNRALGWGYPPGSGKHPAPPGFSGWLDRYASGGIGAADEGNTYANGMPPKTVIGDPSAGVDQLGKTQPDIPTAGGSGGGSTSGSSSGSSSGSGGASGSGSGSESGGGSGTLPGLGPSTPRTPTSPGIGPCVSPCGPDGSTTLVGLGGAMNALGGG